VSWFFLIEYSACVWYGRCSLKGIEVWFTNQLILFLFENTAINLFWIDWRDWNGFPLGAQRPLSRPRTDEHRTSLRGSGTGNPVTRGNLFFLRHKNVSNPPEMTHLIQFSVVTSRVCKSYSRCVFYGVLSFKILNESVSCFSYSSIALFRVMGMAKFWRNKFGYRQQRAD
jgi:hypothetical protein